MRPGPYRFVKENLMRKTSLILTLACSLFAANEPATFTGVITDTTGVITDTLCGRSHGMMKAPSDEACVKMCVKGSGEFALYDGKNILKLSDQKLPAKFAAPARQGNWHLRRKAQRIKVTSIEPLSTGASK
jgi:hypothetical protein